MDTLQRKLDATSCEFRNGISPASTARVLSLTVNYVQRGFRWPFRAGEFLEVWTQDHRLIAEIPAELVLTMVVHHLAAADLVTAVAETLVPTSLGTRAPPTPTAPPHQPTLTTAPGRVIHTAEDRARRRAARRSRKPRAGHGP